MGWLDGEETNSLTFTIWDQAVPALPLFGQLLLALFLMAGRRAAVSAASGPGLVEPTF